MWDLLGLGLFGNLFDFGLNSMMQERQNDFNAHQAQLNRNWQTAEREATQDWNLQQWQRENYYNSPEQQMQRMIAAGINPNSAMQQISNIASGSVRSSAGSGAQASSVGMIQSQIGASLSNYWQNKMMQSQIGLINAQAQGQRETNNWIGPRMMSEVMNNKSNQMYVQEMTNNVKKLNDKYGLEIDYQKGFNDFSKEQWNFQKSCFQIALAFRVQEYINSVNQGVNIEKEGLLIDEKIQTEDVQQGLIGQQTIGQEKENKLKDIAISVGEVKAMFLKDFGIMCDDNTAGVFVKCIQLRAEGKDDEANKLQTQYFDTFEQFATQVEGRTWEHSLGKLLQVPADEASDFMRRFNKWVNSYDDYYPLPF